MDISRFRHTRSQPASQKDIWDWWLSDEKPPASVNEEIRRERVRQANAYTPRSYAPTVAVPAPPVSTYDDVKSVVINLSLPKLDLPRPAANLLSKIPKVALVPIVVIILFVAFVSIGRPTHQHTANTAVQTGAPTTQAAANITNSGQLSTASTKPSLGTIAPASNSVLSASTTSTKPTFIPVVPKNEPQLADSPFARSAYNADAGIYTFIDTFLGKPLTINEEAVTSHYKSSQDALQQNANQISPTQPININGNIAYIQANTSGSQSVVLVLRGVLVVLNSPSVHTTDQWQAYLQTLN